MKMIFFLFIKFNQKKRKFEFFIIQIKSNIICIKIRILRVPNMYSIISFKIKDIKINNKIIISLKFQISRKMIEMS